MDDNGNECVYFVNSRGYRTVLSSPENRNYWELRGRTGFTAVDVETFTQKMASGETKLLGKAPKPRTCSMNMICVGNDSAERDRIFFEMLSVLIDADGSGQGRLYVKRSDGAMAFLNCVYISGANITEKYQKLHQFTLTFLAVDPYFYVPAEYTFAEIYQKSRIITVNNRSNMNMSVSLLIADAHSPNAGMSWTAEGAIKNTTTGKKITFGRYSYRDQTVIPDITLPAYVQLAANISENKFDAYTEDRYGEKASAYNYFNWGETDLGFCLVPGQNTIFFDVESTYRFWNDSVAQFLYKTDGA